MIKTRSMTSASRYHDISCGHRVYGHESKCAHLHGHNYRIHFNCVAEGPNATDPIGRVIDFSVIKERLCVWLEANWDHKFLVWAFDPWRLALKALDPEGVVIVTFNPTAENMAEHLVERISPVALADTGVRVISVIVEETRKCKATYLAGWSVGFEGEK